MIPSFDERMVAADVNLDVFAELCHEVFSVNSEGRRLISMLSKAFPPAGDDFLSDNPVISAYRGGGRQVVAALCKHSGRKP